MSSKKHIDARDVADGMRHRYADRFSAEYLDNESKRSGHGLYIAYGKRFCGSCNSLKPKGKRKATKAWKCDECINQKD